MNIAIVSPFNPSALLDLLNEDSVIDTHISASSVHTTVRGFIKCGHNVSVFTSFVGNNDTILEYSGEKLKIYVIQVKKAYFGINVFRKIRNLFSEHKDEFDVIHAQWTYVYPFSILPFADSIPTLCSVRDWCPYLLTLSKGLREKLQMRINSYFFKRIMNNNNIIKVANSDYTYNMLTDYLHKKDIPNIPNPISSEFVKEDSPVDSISKTVYISICANLLEDRKNIQSLLRAFELVCTKSNNSELILIGKGGASDFNYLNLPNSVLSKITFCGVLSHKQVIERLDNSSILVHPSLEETFGNIFLEAGARNIPSIGGYCSGAVPQVLSYGRAGCLCNVKNPESLANTMLYLAKDSQYKQLIINTIKEKIRTEYIDYVVCDKFIDLYNKTIANRSR